MVKFEKITKEDIEKNNAIKIEDIEKSLFYEESKEVEVELTKSYQKVTLPENYNDIIKYNKDYNKLWRRIVEDIVKITPNGKNYNFNKNNLTLIKILIEKLTILNYDEINDSYSNSKLAKDCKYIFEGLFNNKYKISKTNNFDIEVVKIEHNTGASLKSFIDCLIKKFVYDNKKVILTFENDGSTTNKLINLEEYEAILKNNLDNAILQTKQDILNKSIEASKQNNEVITQSHKINIADTTSIKLTEEELQKDFEEGKKVASKLFN